MPKLEQGRIILAETVDPQGVNPKVRPLVILSENNRIQAGLPIICMGITRQFDKNDPDYLILPYNRSGYSETGLKDRCAAYCRWITPDPIPQDKIVRMLGVVPASILTAIKKRLADLKIEIDESSEFF